jgi:hypothetical protein
MTSATPLDFGKNERVLKIFMGKRKFKKKKTDLLLKHKRFSL